MNAQSVSSNLFPGEVLAQQPNNVECYDIAQAQELRNELVRLHNLAGIEQFGELQASHDQAGSHFVFPASHKRDPNQCEIDIELGWDQIMIAYAFPVLNPDGHLRKSRYYTFLPGKGQISLTTSIQQCFDGMWSGSREVAIYQYVNYPVEPDSPHFENFQQIVSYVHQQCGKEYPLPTRPRHKRVAAWLLGKH